VAATAPRGPLRNRGREPGGASFAPDVDLEESSESRAGPGDRGHCLRYRFAPVKRNP